MLGSSGSSGNGSGNPQSQGMVSSEGARRLMELLFNSIQEKARIQSRHDTEMLTAIDSIDRLRRNWCKSAEEAKELRIAVQEMKAKLSQRDQELKTALAELNDARNDARTQLSEISQMKEDLKLMDNRFKMIQQVIKNISDEQDSDNLDYDETADSCNMEQEAGVLRNGRAYNRSSQHQILKQRSSTAPPKRKQSRITTGYTIKEEDDLRDELPAKRSKEQQERIEVRTTIHITEGEEQENRPPQSQYLFNSENRMQPLPKTIHKRSLRKSFSENSLLKDFKTPPGNFQPQSGRTASTLDIRGQLRTPGGKSWTNGRRIEERRHRFEPLSALLKITTCDVCHGGINFTSKPAVKCSDCQQQVHKTCSLRLPLPCVPRTVTPRTPSRKRGDPSVYRLQDFCPPSTPMIPYPIIHCVVALEKRGLSHEGIYRVPGKISSVTSLLNELRTARAIPKLEMQDTEVITDCIKKFLRELRDPLIPRSSLLEFVRATKSKDMLLALNAAICDLPQPNRDTLAYLCLHWQRVANQAHLSKMPIENIARVVAPSVLIPQQKMDNLNAAGRESRAHEQVMIELLKMKPAYWEKFLTFSAPTPYDLGQSPSIGSTGAGTAIGPLDPSHMAGPSHSNHGNAPPLGALDSPTQAYPPPLIRPNRPYRLFDSPY
ncbi:hypothetical protein WR25_19610 [Diploscapter pachys]|uniref:Rho-GAP domain-containing protein n=1 Tax=Diploscapter pachys TaxID=2018661 RepID=A0A2A2KTX2_9BILA|nr:hypothetical protein WR25_19610 [Diploscapter pachys]